MIPITGLDLIVTAGLLGPAVVLWATGRRRLAVAWGAGYVAAGLLAFGAMLTAMRAVQP